MQRKKIVTFIINYVFEVSNVGVQGIFWTFAKVLLNNVLKISFLVYFVFDR